MAAPDVDTEYDAIVVLGGGSQRGPLCEDLPLWVRRRLELAAFLFKKASSSRDGDDSGPVAAAAALSRSPPRLILLSAGTPHRPNWIDPASGFPVLESTSQAEYLRTRHGIAPAAMWRESQSLDTIGNAYFLRTGFLDPARRGRFRRLAVITSAFHMPRTRAIFDWLLVVDPVPEDAQQCAGAATMHFDASGGVTQAAATLTSAEAAPSESLLPFHAALFGRSASPGAQPYAAVDYFAVSDAGTVADPAVLAERESRERASLAAFRAGICARLAPQRSLAVAKPDEGGDGGEAFLAAAQDFVLGEHKAYCVHEGLMRFPPRETWQVSAATY